VLLYDFQEQMTDAQKARLLALFDRGTGLVVLHHALLSYQDWPEYERIAGGKYLLDNETVDGKTTPASTYEADVELDVQVAAKGHPVTAGVGDFHMKDEMYRRVRNTPDINVLLNAEGHPLAWARDEKKSRVVGIIVGHGVGSYSNPNFQRLLAQSIRWVAHREPAESGATPN
jgi:type 1 glutamine amidotransferase